MADGSKTKVAVAAACTLLLLIIVVLILGYTKDDVNKSSDGDGDGGDSVKISPSQKAISSLCSNTDYKHTCVNTLEKSGGNSTDPKQLIQTAFSAAIKEITKAMKKSVVLDKLEKHPRGKLALQSCRELSSRATSDFERSFEKLQEFDLVHVDAFLDDLQIWLSGAVTYQETCLDGFQSVEGDSGAKMRGFLTTSMHMTSNALAMVTGLSSIVASMIGGHNNRRLLAHQSDDHLPNWIDSAKRRLLKSSEFDRKSIKPNLVVAKDGSGDFTMIMEALLHVPKKSKKTFTLYIKEGIYEEKVQINSSMKHLMIIGDGPTKTKITGKLNFVDGTNTYQTATVAVQADHFTAVDIGFENSAGAEKHQAVALRVGADMAVFYNCQMDGYQDTLYAHTYRQFYRDCIISGTIDFIFGDSAAIFQNCKLVVRKPMENQQCIVTAQGRKDIRQPTGFVVQNCSFIADPAYFPLRNKLKSFLGRPWKEFSRTVIMESFIDDLIAPEGWLPWEGKFALNTLMYTEFNNRGPGSEKKQRLKWEGVKELPPKRVERFTADKFVEGKKWVPPTEVPYEGGFMLEEVEEDSDVEYSPVSPSEVKDKGDMAERGFILSPPHNSTSPDKDKDNDKDKENDKDKDRDKDENEDEKEKKKEKKKKEKEEKEKEKKEKDASSDSPSPSPAANAISATATAPSPAGTKPSMVSTAPSPAATKPNTVSTAPSPATTKPSVVGTAPRQAATKPSMVSTAPSPTATKPSPVATAPSRAATKPNTVSTAPSPETTKASAIGNAPRPAATKPSGTVATAPSPAARTPATAPVAVSQRAATPAPSPEAAALSPVPQPEARGYSVKKFLLTRW